MKHTAELKPCPKPFWAKVAIGGAKECWPWKAAKNAKGYGNFRSRSAHVVAYELVKGPVPAGLEIDHTCRFRGCVNPLHLEAVTHQENVRRAMPTHCKHGHPLSGDNIHLIERPDGVRRKCRACDAVRARKKRANARALIARIRGER